MSVAMSHSPAVIVRQLLVDISQAGDPHWTAGRYDGHAWPAFAKTEPPQPDDCITVYHTNDVVDTRLMRGQLMVHVGLQVRVRTSVSDDGDLKVHEVQRAMAEDVYRRTVTVDATSYLVHNFAKFGPVLSLGMNVPTDKRFLFTINMLAAIRPL